MNNQYIFDPKVLDGVSRDTHEMFKWLKYAQALVAEQKDSASAEYLFFACFNWWQRIMETRHRVFQFFCKALVSDSTPALWLSFQLDCNERDPFVDIFRILALFHPSVLSRTDPNFYNDYKRRAQLKREARSQTDNHGSVLDFPPSCFENDAIEVERSNDVRVEWTCIDEAQEDLQTIVVDKAPVLDDLSKASVLRNMFFDALDLLMNILAIAMYAISHDELFGTVVIFRYFQ